MIKLSALAFSCLLRAIVPKCGKGVRYDLVGTFVEKSYRGPIKESIINGTTL